MARRGRRRRSSSQPPASFIAWPRPSVTPPTMPMASPPAPWATRRKGRTAMTISPEMSFSRLTAPSSQTLRQASRTRRATRGGYMNGAGHPPRRLLSSGGGCEPGSWRWWRPRTWLARPSEAGRGGAQAWRQRGTGGPAGAVAGCRRRRGGPCRMPGRGCPGRQRSCAGRCAGGRSACRLGCCAHVARRAASGAAADFTVAARVLRPALRHAPQTARTGAVGAAAKRA